MNLATSKKKPVMFKNIWNSLPSPFKIEIVGSKQDFKRGNKYDGTLLWDFICRRINPSMTMGASKLKDEIKGKKPSDFDNDIIKYNTCFKDTRTDIIKEEGHGYNKYLRLRFRAYLTCKDQEFLDVIEDEHRKWIEGKLPAKYTYIDLMDLGRVTFNNLMDEDLWSILPKTKEAEGEKTFQPQLQR